MHKGLTSEEVNKSKLEFGTNELEIKRQKKFLNLLLESLGDPIIKILLIALAVKTIFLFKDFDFYETIGIFIAILLATFISTISEYGSEKAFNKLQEDSLKLKSKVRRDGCVQEILINEIVKNDLVILETGDKIPADGVLVKGYLEVDESMLNGETKEAKKYSLAGKVNDNNKLYRGTTIHSGYG